MFNNALRTLFIGLASVAMALGVTAMATSATPAFASSPSTTIIVSMV